MNMSLCPALRSFLTLVTNLYRSTSASEHVIQQLIKWGESRNSYTKELDLVEVTEAIFLGVQKSFDKVWHVALNFKLIKLDISGQLIKIYADYLKNCILCC